ncbi:hypothetical protein A6R68_04225 [Neotoma lepida]|uniref:Uncharacterized protein n=1 Tax=Neotoma lepida TaxID=56216 RepID=A0A1A6GND6_NEOLE|nr:hypothetical protein A6R68_04225 [Neotoma lepida]
MSKAQPPELKRFMDKKLPLKLNGVAAFITRLQRLNLQRGISCQEVGSKSHSALLFLSQVIVDMTTGEFPTFPMPAYLPCFFSLNL